MHAAVCSRLIYCFDSFFLLLVVSFSVFPFVCVHIKIIFSRPTERTTNPASYYISFRLNIRAIDQGRNRARRRGSARFLAIEKKFQGQMICFLFTLPSASLFFSFRFSMSHLTFYTILRIQPTTTTVRIPLLFLFPDIFVLLILRSFGFFWSISFEQYDSWTLKSTEWFWLWHTTPLDLSWKLKKFWMHRDSFTSHSYRTFHFIHPILFVTFNDITTQLFTKVISFELCSFSRLHRQQKNATKSIENERISRLFQMKWCHRKYIKFIVLTTTSVSAKNGTRKQHRVCGKHVY